MPQITSLSMPIPPVIWIYIYHNHQSHSQAGFIFNNFSFSLTFNCYKWTSKKASIHILKRVIRRSRDWKLIPRTKTGDFSLLPSAEIMRYSCKEGTFGVYKKPHVSRSVKGVTRILMKRAWEKGYPFFIGYLRFKSCIFIRFFVSFAGSPLMVDCWTKHQTGLTGDVVNKFSFVYYYYYSIEL